MPGNSSILPKTTDPCEPTPPCGTKPPPLADVLDGVGPSKRHQGGFWGGNWISFVLLLPALVMNLARVPLGISDAFLMGDRSDADYNLLMGLALFLGSFACLLHSFVLPLVKGYGWGWVVPKLIFLGAVWYSMFVVSMLVPPIDI
jgi:hypothetical protein